MGRSAGGGRVANRAACALIVVALFSLACPSSRDDSLAFDHPPEAVILISLDTLRADYLNFHGYEAFETSPFIDSFARESVVFENAFVTQPSTLPSHMSLFTGLYPQRHGADPDTMLFRGIPTMAALMRQSGYATAGFADGGFLRPRWGYGRGFDVYSGRPQRGFRQILDEGIRWIDMHEGERFFLFLHTYDVHSREDGLLYRSPEPTLGRFTRELEEADPDAIRSRIARGPAAATKGDIAYLRARYAEGVRHVDDELRRFFAELRARGLDDRAAIILWSDHGEGLRNHGKWLHGELYDHTLRSVLMIRPPGGLERSRRAEAVVSALDVLPTLLDLVGAPGPKHLDGRSLVGLLRGEPLEPRPAFSLMDEGGDPLYSIRTERFHYISDRAGSKRELFDVIGDPNEERNLSGLQLPVEGELHDRLMAWVERPGAAGSKRAPRRAVEIKGEAEAELRALGYLDPESPPASSNEQSAGQD